MKRHSIPGQDGNHSGDRLQRKERPPVARPAAPPRQRRAGDEPEPIRIPPNWMPSDRLARRRRIARTSGKAALLVAAFGLLSLPFILNHLEKGSFYYQEVPVVLPDIAPGTPLTEPAPVPEPNAVDTEPPIPPAENPAPLPSADPPVPVPSIEPSLDAPALTEPAAEDLHPQS